MNRLTLFAAGAALALVPAAVGLTGNSSFAEGVAVRVPAQATLGSDDITPEPTTTTTAHAEPGDDRGGSSSGSTEAVHRSTHSSEPTHSSAPSTSTDDRGGHPGGHSVSGGSGRHGSSDDGSGHQ